MTTNHPSSPQADPARHDPSEARPAACTCCGGAREADPTDENLRLLRRAATLSLEAMERAALRAQRAMATEPEPDYAAADRADLGLQRAGRCLRFCVALSDKLHTDRLERDRKLALEADYAVTKRKARIKSQVERLVKDAIEQPPEPTAERPERAAGAERETESYDEFDDDFDEEAEEDRQVALLGALAERFKDEDIEADLGLRPISELVARLCADLKIRAPWERWDTQHWALEEVRTKVPGSPFAEMARVKPGPAETPAGEAAPAAAGPEPAGGVPPEEPPPPERPPAAAAQPDEPAGPVKRDMAWYRSAEHQREKEEYLARVRARYLGPPA